MKCPYCSNQIADNSSFCHYCGRKLEPLANPYAVRQVICPACGKVLTSENRFCTGCGKVLSGGSQLNTGFDRKPVQPYAPAQPNAPVSSKKNSNTGMIILAAAVGVIAVTLIVLLICGVFSPEDEPADAAPQESSVQNSESPSDDVSEPPEHQQELELVCSGTTGTLTLREWNNGEWETVLSLNAYIGKNGISYNKQEGDRCTPAGTFDVLYWISTSSRSSGLEYRPVHSGDLWICDPDSGYYNQWVNANSVSADWDSAQTENLYSKFSDGYSVACIVFDYNGNGLSSNGVSRNGGSDIFIDGVGSKGNLTSGYGDIKITASDMYQLLDRLDSDKNPILVVR